jgi:hypothetical protein
MKILSYKILSEAAFSDIKTIAKLKNLTKQGGNPTFSLTYFKYLVKITFGIAPILEDVKNFISPTFAASFEGDEMFLYPWYDEKVAALEETNAKKWGSLQLYDINNPNTPQDIEGYFLNPSDLEFRFNFKVGDINTFNQVNKLYRYANLNILSPFINTPPTQDFKIRMTNTIMRDLSISRNQSNVINRYFIDMNFIPALSGSSYNNPITGRYKITFNNARSPLGNIQGFNNVSSFAKVGGSGGVNFYIFTQQPFTTSPGVDVECYVDYYNNNAYQRSVIMKYNLKALTQN